MAKASDIIVGKPFDEVLSAYIKGRDYTSVFFVADRRFKSKMSYLTKRMNCPCYAVFVAGSEKSKRLKSFQDVISKMIEVGADRKTLVVAIGGGVIGDLAGFSAAVYMRGVSWVSIPTTLLGMIDSGYGGKTAINHPKMKNSIGAFHMSELTIIDPYFLKTLSKRDMVSGAGELLKYGLLLNASFFRQLSPKKIVKWSKKPNSAVPTIRKCIGLKAKIVAEDFKESSGRRVLLNLGHTGAHAFETVTGYDFFRHGEAVILGLELCVRVSRIQGLLGKARHDLILDTLRQFDVPKPKNALSYQDIWKAMRRDKKSESGRVRMVLLSEIGKPLVGQSVASSDVMLALIEMAEEGMLSIK